MQSFHFFLKIQNPFEHLCEQEREATYQNNQVLPG